MELNCLQIHRRHDFEEPFTNFPICRITEPSFISTANTGMEVFLCKYNIQFK